MGDVRPTYGNVNGKMIKAMQILPYTNVSDKAHSLQSLDIFRLQGSQSIPCLAAKLEPYGGFLSHRATPSYHPFIDGFP